MQPSNELWVDSHGVVHRKLPWQALGTDRFTLCQKIAYPNQEWRHGDPPHPTCLECIAYG